MERRVAVVVLGLAVVLAAVPSGGLAQAESATVTPGERFAGVVGVQQAEVESSVESRAFDVRFERAESNASRAALIAERTNETGERLQELQERKDRLQQARENGSISEGQFRARMARLVAESNALQRQLDQTATASERVPDRALRERGVDPDELDRLRTAAGNLTGPEVAAIARNITGDRAGTGPPAGVGPGEERRGGPPTDAGDRRADGGDGDAANRTATNDGAGGGQQSGDAAGDGPSQSDGSTNAGDGTNENANGGSANESARGDGDGGDAGDGRGR